MKKEAEKQVSTKLVEIKAPNFKTVVFRIVGKTPLVMNKFSKKAREAIKATQQAGSQRKKRGAPKEAKDFDACYEAAFHRSKEGWPGVPASSFRAAMISACRLTGFAMTMAKLTLFVEADGIDVDEGTPLVRIEGDPRPLEMAVRNDSGVCDIRVRPIFERWSAEVRVRFDGDIFSEQSVANLLMRAGLQVGIGEGRADSKKSAGMGWGAFALGGPRK